VRYALPTLDPVTQISIIPSGRALGYTMFAPTEDRYSEYKQELEDNIASLLGGRVAEELIFGDVSGGASNDIQRATKIAQKMVTKLGMSGLLGPICYGSDQGEVFLGRDFSSSQDYSDETANKIDEEVHRLITEAYEKARKILQDNMDKLHFISEFLLKNETMDGEQFYAAMDGDKTFEELENMTEAKLRRSREENDRRLAEEAKKAQAEAERRAAQDLHSRDGDPKDNDSEEENRFSGNH
jgi:cell division protease FtsH